jgi:uncharacterized protein (DUF58 family)
MISKEIAQQIWQIQLKTKKVLSGTMIGDKRAARKGHGFEFDQVRDYAQGDDLRFIDWKATARTGKLLTKQYFEERNHNIMIALDVSSSSFTGGRYHLLSQLAAIFALVAEYSKDNVGLRLFSDKINLKLPIKRGSGHVMRLLETVLAFKNQVVANQPAGTNLELVLNDLAKSLKTKSLVVLISDLIDSHDYERALKGLQIRHDVVVVRCLNHYEQQLPNVGLLPMVDPETGEVAMIDTRKSGGLNEILKTRLAQQNLLLRSCGVDLLDVHHEDQAVAEVVKFFRKRLMY